MLNKITCWGFDCCRYAGGIPKAEVKEENGEVSCSVEETNRIRALLGLKVFVHKHTIYIYTYVHTYTHTYLHLQIYSKNTMYIYTYISTNIHTHTCIYKIQHTEGIFPSFFIGVCFQWPYCKNLLKKPPVFTLSIYFFFSFFFFSFFSKF